jgi:trans-aconitate methyltransferase
LLKNNLTSKKGALDYDHFLSILPKKASSILEFGCGPGNITKYLLQKTPEHEIRGFDISKKMIQLA